MTDFDVGVVDPAWSDSASGWLIPSGLASELHATSNQLRSEVPLELHVCRRASEQSVA